MSVGSNGDIVIRCSGGARFRRPARWGALFRYSFTGLCVEDGSIRSGVELAVVRGDLPAADGDEIHLIRPGGEVDVPAVIIPVADGAGGQDDAAALDRQVRTAAADGERAVDALHMPQHALVDGGCGQLGDLFNDERAVPARKHVVARAVVTGEHKVNAFRSLIRINVRLGRFRLRLRLLDGGFLLPGRLRLRRLFRRFRTVGFVCLRFCGQRGLFPIMVFMGDLDGLDGRLRRLVHGHGRRRHEAQQHAQDQQDRQQFLHTWHLFFCFLGLQIVAKKNPRAMRSADSSMKLVHATSSVPGTSVGKPPFRTTLTVIY